MEQEGIIRLSIFFGLFFVFAATEYIFPRRMVTKSKARRWITNWSVSFLNVLTLRLFLSVSSMPAKTLSKLPNRVISLYFSLTIVSSDTLIL